MSIGTRIKELRTELNFTQVELAEKIGVTKGAIANYENGVSIPKPEIMYKLFVALQCDANYLYQDDMNMAKANNILSQNEKKLLMKYKSLDTHGKDIVNSVLSIEYERMQKTDTTNESAATYKMSYYDLPASAGIGNPLDYEALSTVQVTEVPPRKADYILKVSGDSMEPTFYDGDYIYVQKTSNLDYGDIGIFVLSGNVYIKEYGENGLVSHNPEYRLIEGTEDIRCLGKVLRKVDGKVIH